MAARRAGGYAIPSTVPPTPPTRKLEFSERGDEAIAESVGPRIQTLEQLLEALQVDLDVWEVDHWTGNVWEQHSAAAGIVSLYQVKAYFKRSRAAVAANLIADLRADLRQYAPAAPRRLVGRKRPSDGYMLELSITDLHFGKYAWRMETGEPYGMDMAEQLYLWAVETLVQRATAVGPISQVLLPTGSDLFHIDTPGNTTTGGTPQDVHGTYRQHFRRVRLMLRRAIDLLQEVAPVYVKIIGGNHDRFTTYHLGEALEDWYFHNGMVQVDNAPRLRKYHKFGRCLVGFTHGSDEKPATLPLIMAQEAAASWAQTSWREWHIGHIHKKRETQFLPVDEFNGVRVRVVPALTAVDNWHYLKGYVHGIRAAEGYLWHPEYGQLDVLTAAYQQAAIDLKLEEDGHVGSDQ